MSGETTTRAGREEGGSARETAALHWEATALRYQEIHDRSPDGMMIFRAARDTGGKIVDFEWLYCNASAGRIIGRRAEDLLGKRLLVEMPGNKEAGLFDIYAQVVELGEPHSHEFPYRYEGLDSWFRATSLKLGDGFYVAFSDLTTRKRAEEQAARLAAIVRSSEHAIYSTSGSDVVETWNKGAEKLYGYGSAEMVGQSILSIVPEHCRLEREQALRRILERGGVESFQTVRLSKVGTLVHVSITFSPIRDADGVNVGTAIIARDVSEQMMLQARLVVADRLVSVGTLAAGMAHQINNPLNIVTANLDLVIEEVRLIGGGSPSARLRELGEMSLEARAGADRIGKIVRALMTFSRTDTQRLAVVDVRRVLDLCVGMAFNDIRRSARVVKVYGEVPFVLADDGRLAQVFIHLLVNAAEAMEGDTESNEIRIATSTDDAGRAVVEIHDTGTGILPGILGRVFDPFFTTKSIGLGAGLGLSICHHIVTAMGGEIAVMPRQGRGTTLRVVLPPAPRPSSDARDVSMDAAGPASGDPGALSRGRS